MSMLFLCTNYNFSGCVKKGTNLADVVDSKIFDRQKEAGIPECPGTSMAGLLKAYAF